MMEGKNESEIAPERAEKKDATLSLRKERRLRRHCPSGNCPLRSQCRICWKRYAP